MSDRSQSDYSDQSDHSNLQTRSCTPDISTLPGSEVLTQRDNIVESTLNILRTQVNALFDEVDNNNKRVDNLWTHFDQFRDDVDGKINNLRMDISRDLKSQSDNITANVSSLIEGLFEKFAGNNNNSDLSQSTSVKTVVPPLNTHFGTNTQVINSPNDQIHRTVSDATCTPVYTSTSRMSTTSRSFAPIDHNQGNVNTYRPKPTIMVTEPRLPELLQIPEVRDRTPVNIGFTKPHEYDGKTSWSDYLIHFETVANLNNWSGRIKAMKLIACMQDNALSTIGDINTSCPPSFEELVNILTKRFEPKNQMELYRNQMDARIRKKGETLPELAQDIKRLVRLAYPHADQETRDSLAFRSFRDALNDKDLALAVCQGNIETIEEALNVTLKYEAVQQSYTKPSVRQVSTGESIDSKQSKISNNTNNNTYINRKS